MSFKEIEQKAKEEWESLQRSKKPSIFVGTATCGRSAGALEVLETFHREIENFNINANVVEVGCLGLCYAEPLVGIVKPGRPNIWYRNITPERAKELIEGYLLNDNPLVDYALGTTGDGGVEGIPNLFDLPVLKSQVRRVLRNCGFIDPTNINHYIANGGYQALHKALFEMTPEQVIDEVKRSGLRGLGGAGFPTGRKWEFCRRAPGEEKYVVCNADEGDPGAFQDRLVLEGDPHSVLEGMIIAGYAVGAKMGYIYVRAEYPLAVKRLQIAIAQARERGFLGKNILGSGFDFDLKIFQGAGAFVCGEETALIASIEGRRGMPRHRPPYPAISGLWDKPTSINNVKTLANIRWIINQGADWFAGTGTKMSKGTAVFSLTGKIANSGLIEVPMGITLGKIIYEIGGGVLEGKAFKAVQTGGPSGGCLPASLLDTLVDFDSLIAAGSIMGSGGMVVMDEDTCMVDVARYFLDFIQKESCGQCSLCRLGSLQMLEILNAITEGKGKMEDIDLLIELGEAIKIGSLCGLGQTAPNPVLTTIHYFRDEYEAHILEKRCPARVCRALISYRILPDKCKACMICLRECPVGAIGGGKRQVHVIDQNKCIRCGVCLSVCPERFSAVECVPGRLANGG
jgi:NADH:ubiquinone oxidoreductase subunit F (NADH-binding)/(2Fe-2S) ferredoxin/Pyruvate/2-oxoacid:ferredoxin oxidoreductase delta subunit